MLTMLPGPSPMARTAARQPKSGVDADNTAWLREQMRELGWIDASRFGPDASFAAFLIVQHSQDLPLMLAALPEIEADVRAKRFNAHQLDFEPPGALVFADEYSGAAIQRLPYWLR